MGPIGRALRRSLLGLSGLAGLAACDAAEPPRNAFRATGELIAMSGGDGGSRNACFTCHGLNGEGDGVGSPRLAGLNAGYLQRQLDDYATGRRADLVMAPIARRLTADDRHAVSAWYAAKPATLTANARGNAVGKSLYHRGDPKRGLQACAACHGVGGEGQGPANPPLAGQPSGYIAEQLTRWAKAERRNDPRDVMLDISRKLTPAEIDAVSSYASAPSGHLLPIR
ncbi:c-type cytochrome [Caulobacter sp. NIBR2454]|uniref:c-type cytochrome n=1 Tax=Caulobacter sp. NIBR2454 TaxID=3015996 RepID=UPI003FA47838